MAILRKFVTATRPPIVRRVVAIGHYYGWPRSPTIDEVLHADGRQVSQAIRESIVWRWWARIRTDPGGYAIILDISHPRLVEVHGRELVVPAVYGGFSVPGGAGTVTIDLTVGVPLVNADNDSGETDP